jgi:LDH2 family malate/lactate/ureidoglycolate dehydrogenase
MITHRNVGHYAKALTQAIGIRPDDRYLHTASFSFSSSVRQFVLPLTRGASVTIAAPEELRDPQRLFETIRDQDVTLVDLVPSFSANCLQILTSLAPSMRDGLLDNKVRLMLSASESLPWALVKEWRRLCRSDVAFVNMYGQTETTGIVLTCPVLEGAETATTVPIGKPIANTQAYVLDASGRVVPVGVCGELHVGGAGIGRGYVDRPEQTAKSFVSRAVGGQTNRRLYRTGDLARYRADGVIEFVGRADEQIKVRGFRVEPGEIETAIRKFPGVRECAVTAAADADNEGRLIAFVVDDGRAADAASLASNLRAFLAEELPKHMVPERIYRLSRLPRTPSGKLDLQAMLGALVTSAPRARGRVEQTAGGRHARGRRDIGGVLTEIWKRVLGVDGIAPNDNFFDLGGNSRLCVKALFEAKEAGLQLTLSQIYQHQTIAELVRALGESGTPAGLGSPVRGLPSDLRTAPLLTIDSLRAFGREALLRAGLDREGAEIVTEVQLEASMRGQPTHDIVSIPRYATRVATGRINPRPRITTERETATTAQVDGDNGPGQWVSTVAIGIAARKAREQGIGIVSARRSNHFGAAGHYVWEAARRGLIGLCTTNGPAVLAPTGGVTPTFGNNPLAIGIPAGRHFPIVLDIAMSVAPRSKIGLAVAEGKPLPPGWIFDRAGQPSTDLADLAAGLGVPIGGHKGYGLALALEVLAGVLTGAGFGADHRSEVMRGRPEAPDFGHLFVVIDPERFMPGAHFADRVDALIEQTKNGERAPDVDEILVPGERELRARERSLKEGVRLRLSTYRALLSYGREKGLDAELILARDPLIA